MEAKKLRVSMTGGLIENDNYLSGCCCLGGKPLVDGIQSGSRFIFAPGQYGRDGSVVVFYPDKIARHCTALIEQ
jgi:hypothetical protein